MTYHLAGELGFEPRLTESESAVLPVERFPNTASFKRGNLVIIPENKKGAKRPLYLQSSFLSVINYPE